MSTIKCKGFTLLETVIYIALLSVILTGLLVSVYPLFTGTERINAKVTAEGEAAFILRKVAWMLSDATAVTSPAFAGALSSTFRVVRYSGSPVIMRLNPTTGELEISEDDGVSYLLLTASRVKVENFEVTRTAPSGQTLISVEFDINGQHVGPWQKYLHL